MVSYPQKREGIRLLEAYGITDRRIAVLLGSPERGSAIRPGPSLWTTGLS
jgi:hypothetical protein